MDDALKVNTNSNGLWSGGIGALAAVVADEAIHGTSAYRFAGPVAAVVGLGTTFILEHEGALDAIKSALGFEHTAGNSDTVSELRIAQPSTNVEVHGQLNSDNLNYQEVGACFPVPNVPSTNTPPVDAIYSTHIPSVHAPPPNEFATPYLTSPIYDFDGGDEVSAPSQPTDLPRDCYVAGVSDPGSILPLEQTVDSTTAFSDPGIP